MCRAATVRRRGGYLLVLLLAAQAVLAQGIRLDWRPIGNHMLDAGLAGPASGAVDRVWYSADGQRLAIRTRSGMTLQTLDFERWTPSLEAPPPVTGDRNRKNWNNLTTFQGRPILGPGLTDVAISPTDPEQVVLANEFGVWRSMDGGLSWDGLNGGLRDLPARRLLRVPERSTGARILLKGNVQEAAWVPGEREAWQITDAAETLQERELTRALGPVLGTEPSRATIAGGFVYAGSADGVLWVSSDEGRTWRSTALAGAGSLESIFVSRDEPRIAVAVLTGGDGRGTRVARTSNGGVFWDDITNNLPAGSAHGVTLDLASGSVYIATDAGLFWTTTDLRSAGPVSAWIRLETPGSAVQDVALDADGNQLFALADGAGLIQSIAPHRFRDPRLVSAADGMPRPAAPGSLLSVLGSEVSSARWGDLEVPVLAASSGQSQIQVPFEAAGTSLTLAFEGAGASRRIVLPLRETAPVIFVDRDATPMILDADRAILLDAGTPARAGSRIQILAAGLGKVTPDWPTGLPAPLDGTPRVVAPVRVYLDRLPLRVTRASLAPGYVGFYLIEAQVPDIVNAGPAELYVAAGGGESNRVTLYVVP